MPRQRRQPDPHAAWLASLHPALRLLAEWRGWQEIGGGTLVVACSGGRDSVALAHCAWTLLKGAERESFAAYLTHRMTSGDPKDAATGPYAGDLCEDAGEGARAPRVLPELILWHFDHGLRDDSHLDAQFVRELGAQWGVQVLLDEGRLREQPEYGSTNTLELARDARYAALSAWACPTELALDAASALSQPVHAILAHHAQDQAETLLHNITRGAGLSGLRGMQASLRPFEHVHRPWLALSAEGVQGYFNTQQLGYRADPGNSDPARLRARLRRDVLPVLTGLNPRAVEHIAALGAEVAELLAELREESASFLDELLLLPRLPLALYPPRDYHVIRLPDLPRDSQRMWHQVGAWVEHYAGGLERQQVRSFRDWLGGQQGTWQHGETRFQSSGRMLAVETPGHVERMSRLSPEFIPRPHGVRPVKLDSIVSVEELPQPLDKLDSNTAPRIRNWWDYVESEMQRQERVRREQPDSELHVALHQAPEYICCLPPDCALPLSFRAPRDGDRILTGSSRSGQPMSRLLSDLFIDTKVPRCYRRAWLTLVDANDSILWLPGLIDGAAMRAAGSAGVAVRVRVRPTANLRLLLERNQP